MRDVSATGLRTSRTGAYHVTVTGEPRLISGSVLTAESSCVYKQARTALLKAKEDAKNDLTVDLLSVNLMDAYNAILDILGERNKTDLSKEIFSRFCVGK